MLLAIDTGNTHTVLGCIDENGTVLKSARMETQPKKTEYEYASDISRIFELMDVSMSGFDDVIISSVVPNMISILKKACKLMTGIDAKIVGDKLVTDLIVDLDTPEIAADLVAAAVGAKEKYPFPTIIIDMGTATTLSVLSKEGHFLGGAIVPGVNIALRALTSGTSLLPNIELTIPPKAIGSNTTDCMKSGNVYGAIGALDGLIERFTKELGEEPTIVATGGLARYITPYCKRNIILDDDLLLYGLWVLWNKNR